MVNKEHLSLRILVFAFVVLLAAMIFAGLYPFNFFPPNLVGWVPDEPGLYFDGSGIAYTDKAESISLKKSISIELLLKERRGSKNWGPNEIFSFFDGAASPSILVGQWDGRIFIFSRFEKNEGHEWYRQFRTKHRFPKDKTHLVTITFDENEKAIYIDGQLSNRKNVELNDMAPIVFSGCFLLGSSPRGKYGWRGEVKGLAVYSRVLLPDEIVRHSREFLQKGASGLTGTPDCLALYPFDEGEGKTAKSILSKSRPFSIPVSLNTLGMTILSLPYKDMRFFGYNKIDFIKNVILFLPFGILLALIMLKKFATGNFVTFLIVPLAGGLLSCIIEGFQFFIPARIPGMADILSNILGSGIGMLVTFIIMKEKS